MYPIVYCIVALVLQFAYYYGKRYVVGLYRYTYTVHAFLEYHP